MTASHRDLLVWRNAIELVEEVYRLVAQFPSDERYRLVDQLRRAVVSVPANIAEGSGRGSNRDYARFLGIAKGSLMEVETLLMLALRLGYVSEADVAPVFSRVTEISKMLTSFRAHIRRHI